MLKIQAWFCLGVLFGAAPILATNATNAKEVSSLLVQQLNQYPCNRQFKAEVGEKLMRRTWIPVTLFEGSGIIAALSHRDSKEQKAYVVSVENLTTRLIKSDLKTKEERVFTWSSKDQCKVQVKAQQFKEPQIGQTKGFTNADLNSTLSKNKWGVIYVWSPYMPLSVKAIKEIEAAVSSKGGALTILVDGKANPDQVEAWVKKGLVVGVDKGPANQTTPVTSPELYARGLGLHYPMTFIYKNGYISNHTYVGHKEAETYRRWISLELKSIDRELL